MNFLQATVLSIIEGLTEFLPISSTGHLILANNLMGIAETDFIKSFSIAIQLGAIFAVVWIYKKDIINNHRLWPKIILAFAPTAVLGFIFYRFIKSHLLGSVSVTLSALAVGGICLIVFEKFIKVGSRKIWELSWHQLIMVGLFQTISMIPGVSRSAATIIGGLYSGLSREEAVKFSFLLAIPTMLAATGLDMAKSGWRFSSQEFMLIGLGTVAAFLTAKLSVEWLIKFVRRHTLAGFGVYRLFLAGVFWWISK